MANVLVTNRCNQSCSYCFAQKEMKKERQEMSFSNFERVLDFLKKSRDNNLRLMGGEPTLHTNFKEMVDFALSRNFPVHVFTNGIFSKDILDFLKEKGRQIKYSFNINPREQYSDESYNQVLYNIKNLSVFENILLGTVVQGDNFNIDQTLDIAKKYQIRSIVLRVANPVSLVGGDVLIKEIEKLYKNNTGVGFGCGLSEELFSRSQMDILKNLGLNKINFGCRANSGRFDIGVDLSVVRCFPLAKWNRKRLFDFKSTKEIEDYFDKKMKNYQSKSFKKDFINNGPCFANLLK